MANEITMSTTMSDQEKALASQLIARSAIHLVCQSVCTTEKQPDGTGVTHYFIRYERTDVPLDPMSEGVTPGYTALSTSQVTVELDQWGAVMAVTDRAKVTTKHPLVQETLNLLADSAQRVIDREIQVVWLAGTNVQYGDGSVTTRADITSSMVLSETIIGQARVTMVDAGASPRGGPEGGIILGTSTAVAGTEMRQGIETAVSKGGSINKAMNYIAITAPQVIQTLLNATNFLAVHSYNDKPNLYVSEVGTWMNIRWVESNFTPKFTLLGSTTDAVVSGNAFGTDTPVVTAVNGGGSLNSGVTYFFKVTAKKKDRGFEERISDKHSMASAASGNNESFTFDFTGVSDDYVYALYFDDTQTGSAGTDAHLKLYADNIESGETVTVTAVATSSTTAPPNIHATGTGDPATVFVVYIHGEKSTAWVGLRNFELKVATGADKTDPLDQLTTMGWKFDGKAMIYAQERLLRLEIASTYV